MDPAHAILAAVLGVCVGSFLNVCIYRLPRGQSLASPPSRCPGCERPLRWYHNIPIVSWIALRGRCAYCHAPISMQYPIIELVTALVWVLIVWMTPVGWLLASRLVLATALIVLFMIDLEHQLLPNVITLPGILVGSAFSFVAPPGPVDSLLGILLGGGVLYGIAAAYYVLRKEEGMGMGDVKMLAMVGAFLGWRAVLLTLVLSSFAGAVIGVAMMGLQKGNLRYALPFGTFLAAGTLIAMLFGERMLEWYLGYFPAL
ncbi:MAG TPA: prepilin peptidase [Vicinamibacterales bacterium]|nr:prepilin peptidase [Vicinamibacterales bacterium]